MAFSEENGGMVMPVTPMYGQGGNGFGFGDNGWWIILLFILLGGWGNGGTGAANNYVLASDMSMLERRTDSIINGICDSSYANAQLINGLQQTMYTQGYETRNAINNVQSQLASCCCDMKGAIKDINYNMAMNNNMLQSSICNSTRDILDALNAQNLEAKNDRISSLERQLTMANLAASQHAQTAALIADNAAQTRYIEDLMAG